MACAASAILPAGQLLPGAGVQRVHALCVGEAAVWRRCAARAATIGCGTALRRHIVTRCGVLLVLRVARLRRHSG